MDYNTYMRHHIFYFFTIMEILFCFSTLKLDKISYTV
jgi:hypothetical protein